MKNSQPNRTWIAQLCIAICVIYFIQYQLKLLIRRTIAFVALLVVAAVYTNPSPHSFQVWLRSQQDKTVKNIGSILTCLKNWITKTDDDWSDIKVYELGLAKVVYVQAIDKFVVGMFKNWIWADDYAVLDSMCRSRFVRMLYSITESASMSGKRALDGTIANVFMKEESQQMQWENGEEVDDFVKNAKQHRMEKDWTKASAAFLRAAQIVSDPVQKSKHQLDASLCFMELQNHSSLCEAEKLIVQACNVLADRGHFRKAARSYRELADAYVRLKDRMHALDLYGKAIQYFEADEARIEIMSTKDSMAHIYAHLGNWEKSFRLFECVGMDHLEQGDPQGSIMALFNAALSSVLLPQGIAFTKTLIQRYRSLNAQFASSRYEEFISDIVDAMEVHNANAFTKTVENLRQHRKLEAWQNEVLLEVHTKVNSMDLR